MSDLPEIDGLIDLHEIGRGGFGVVYRGSETEFDRDVAVKVLLPTLDNRTRQRFERERRAMGAVSGHPNIVTVYRGGRTGREQPYLVMEYLRGGSLSERLANVGPLDWRAAGIIGAKLADALNVAHRAGILHRDVKPGNIFLTHDGEPKLGDFGIARLDDGQDSRSGSITASIAHAPPEIIDGQRGDERSDLYSLASTVYALAKGTAPFARDPDQGLARLLARITSDAPPPLHFETAAAEFEAVLMRALSKDPQQRQQTVAEFGNQLQRAVANIATPATPQLIDAPVEVQSHKSTGQLAFFALLALAIAGFGGWAVARAVFDSTPTLTGETTAATAVVIETATAAPTAQPEQPTAEPEPPTAEPVPTPTAEPEPEPEPTVSTGLDNGGRIPFGYSSIVDPTGVIRVTVPSPWLSERGTSDEVDLINDSTRVFALGGSFADLSGDPETRDLSKSGVYIFVTRLSGPAGDSQDLLDVSLDQWSDCDRGDRSQILLNDGNASFQILQCPRDDGETSGVVVMTLTVRDDPEVAVAMTMQFADLEDLDGLTEILGSLDINPELLP